MKTLRTPDDRFDGLPDFGFAPHYVEIDDGDGGRLRAHYLDEGPADAAPVLLLHGEPSWCFLYRYMIPVLVAAGHRVVAPDLVGFGRSDKPTRAADYTFARHVGWMSDVLFDHLDLRHITYFGQDWGGLIGLRLVGGQPERFDRIVIGNSGLPVGDRRPNEAFMAWQKYSRDSPRFKIGEIINRGCATTLPPEVIAAYDAPFPDDTFMAGPRILPSLVPTTPDDPSEAANAATWDVLRRFDRPFLCTFSDGDPMTAGGDRAFLREVPGTAGQDHVTVVGAAHFLQEDQGPTLAKVIADFIEATP
jgi:haloalkane dehalogenase